MKESSDRRIIERQIPSEEGIKDDPEAPNVSAPAVIMDSANHFRSGIVRGPAGCLSDIPANPSGESKICNFDAIRPVKKDVFRLEIPVANPMRVKILKPECDLPEKVEGKIF
jgi:hypothetical protein